MRSAASITAGLCAVAVLALAIVAVGQKSSLAFTLGVPPVAPVVTVEPGQEVCQTPIAVPAGADFDRIALKLGTFGQPGPRIGLTVREDGSGRVLRRGEIPAGYPDVAKQGDHVVPVGEVAAGNRIQVCLRNDGDRKVAIYGSGDAASRTSSALFAAGPAGMDLSLRFERSERSMASLLGAMADRAALFKAGWVGGWTFWLLGALVLLAVPALLVRAVRGALE